MSSQQLLKTQVLNHDGKLTLNRPKRCGGVPCWLVRKEHQKKAATATRAAVVERQQPFESPGRNRAQREEDATGRCWASLAASMRVALWAIRIAKLTLSKLSISKTPRCHHRLKVEHGVWHRPFRCGFLQ